MSVSDILSARELEIARAYADGANYQQIAQELFIAPTTVRTHLATIYRKLAVSSKVALRHVLEGGERVAQEDQSALLSELALSLEEAIARERAYAAVLRIINDAHGHLDDVISAVLEHALTLCDAEYGVLFEYQTGAGFNAAFTYGIPGPFKAWFEEQGFFRVAPETGLGRMEREHAFVNIADVRGERAYRDGDPLRAATVDLGGARSFAAIPMREQNELIGAFCIYRQSVRPFDQRTLDRAAIFADQSVIAIRNARLLAGKV